MISTLIAFLFLLIVLNKFLYKPLLGFMDNRNGTIKNDLESASKNSEDITSYHEEAEKIILDAKGKALKNRLDVLNEAKLSHEKRVAEKKSELESEYNTFLKEIDTEKNALKTALLAQMSSYKEVVNKKLNQI
jgi:F-type H+-transporting ATPase subunit b